MATRVPVADPNEGEVIRAPIVTTLLGLVAGTLSALLGIGGGLIMVPAMVHVLRFRSQRAVGTSLAVIIPTAIVAAWQYHQQYPFNMWVVVWLSVGGVFGALIGAHIANAIGAKQLRRIFGLFVIVTAVVMMVTQGPPTADAAHRTVTLLDAVLLIVTGVFVGIVSGLLGVGGGLVMVPALVLGLGYSQHLAQGASLAVIVPVALSGTSAHARRGNISGRVAFFLTLGAVIGAYVIGGRVDRITDQQLRMLFGIFLFVIGLSMIIQRRERDATAPR